VIENHEGIIDIESSIGEGTSFVLYLPAAVDALESENSGEYGLKTASRRVLLMDDDQAVREAASGLLETLGFSVVEADDGYEAVVRYRDALVNGHVFDFCLLDQIVPNGMSGSECAKEILTLDPEAVLFLCSGYSDDPIFSEYREAGFRALIKKPYTLEELKSTLGNHLVS
jgi:CheY-like chemotaxis protein